jgi:hypothetical protein
VVALVVVMLDEGLDLLLEIAGQEVVLQQHTVFERLMPAFDLALGLGMDGLATVLCRSPERLELATGDR